MDYQVSHAQNREDVLIAGFFPDVSEGFYVDVGAGHPAEQSATKLLYDRGWRGINIEPIPELAEALQTERSRDVTLQVALGAAPGHATFRQYPGWGLSTLDPDMKAQHAAQPTSWTSEFTEYDVPVTTLAAVLEEHPVPHVHVLKIDVEGAEFEVLQGADWNRFRPDLICIETEHVRRDWQPMLQDAGYAQVFHDGLNAYLLSSEARDRADRFNYADLVLNGPIVVTPVEAAEFETAQQLRVELAEARHEADALRAVVSERDAVVAELTERVAEFTETLAERDATIAELDATASDLTQALAAESELRALYTGRHAEVTNRLATTEAYLAEVVGSTSWRITYPMRRSVEMIKARVPRHLLVRIWTRLTARSHAVQVAPPEPAELSPDAAAILARMRELE